MYAGKPWPRDSWLKGLRLSRSGQRLKHLVDDYDQCENTTGVVADNPNGRVPPDFDYILEIIRRRQPKIIVTCGLQARDALRRTWGGPLLAVPHPAYRYLTNELYQEAKALLTPSYVKRAEMLQLRGCTELIDLTQEVRLYRGKRPKKKAATVPDCPGSTAASEA